MGTCICHIAMADELTVWDTSQEVSLMTGPKHRIESWVTLTAPLPDSVITVGETMSIDNRGTIDASLVASGANYITINNMGTITGRIEASRVTQIVSSDAGAQALTVVCPASNFFVSVSNATDGVTLNNIKNLGSASVELDNSLVIMDDLSEWQSWGANIFWTRVNTLQINDLDSVVNGTYIAHAAGGTILNVVSGDENKMYRIDSVHDENGIMLNVVRETNYQIIFNDNRGMFLDNLRLSRPNDRTLMAMDAAENMDGLNNVMNSSYHFNSALLAKPVKAINNLSIINILSDDDVSGIGVNPFYVGSDALSGAGVRAHVGTGQGDYSFTIGLNLNKFNYEDNINDFGGMLYGVDVKIKRNFEKFYMIGQIGFDSIEFDADNIYTSTDIKNNPHGYALYGGFSAMTDFDVSSGMIVSPFAGATFRKFNVMDYNENNVNLHAGGKIKYHFVIDSIKYEYGGMFGVMENGNLFGNLKVGFDSLVDNAGLSINVSAYQDDTALTYQASINARVLF